MKNAFITYALIITEILNAQATSVHLDSLQSYLFPVEKDTIAVFEYLSCNESCNSRTIYPDSFLHIRKYQPHPSLVINELRYLMSTGDTTIFSELESIYKTHILNFEREWLALYKKNIYPFGLIEAQFDILVAFEQCLKSLQVRKEGWEADRICNFFIEEKLAAQRMISSDFRERGALVNQMWYFSERYHNLRKMFPLRSCPIYWVTPFVSSIQSCVIGRYIDCDLDEPGSKDLCEAFRGSGLVLEERSEELANYYVLNLEKWKSKYYDSAIYNYAGLHYFPELSKILVTDILVPDSVVLNHYFSKIPKEKLDYYLDMARDTKIGYFCKSEQNVHLLCGELLKLSQNDMPMVKTILSYMPRESSLQYFKGHEKQSRGKGKVKEILSFLEPKKVKG